METKKTDYSKAIPGEWVPVAEIPYKIIQQQQITKVAIKKDELKSRVDLIDPDWLLGIGDVLRFGATKYSDNNWRLGFKFSRLIAACFRHLLAIMRSEDIDPESGLPHVDHLGCSVMFLAWHLKNKPELDDRWKS